MTGIIITPLGAASRERRFDFTCGDPDLDDFLRDDAWRLQAEHVATTYLARDSNSGDISGYATLLNDAVSLQTSERKKLGLASDDHPIVPAIKIARLGVNSSSQAQGIGLLLVRTAYFTARRCDPVSGCRLLTVDAYPDSLNFYRKLGFVRNRAKEYRDREHPSLHLDVFGKHAPAWL